MFLLTRVKAVLMSLTSSSRNTANDLLNDRRGYVLNLCNEKVRKNVSGPTGFKHVAMRTRVKTQRVVVTRKILGKFVLIIRYWFCLEFAGDCEQKKVKGKTSKTNRYWQTSRETLMLFVELTQKWIFCDILMQTTFSGQSGTLQRATFAFSN